MFGPDDAAGGGDRSLGVFDPDDTLFTFWGRGRSAAAGSGVVGGGRWGIVGADNLRWTAAAEGTEGMVELEVC